MDTKSEAVRPATTDRATTHACSAGTGATWCQLTVYPGGTLPITSALSSSGGSLMSKETQPPCVRCRHAETCNHPPTCHALRYFKQTGLPITPPFRNPCPQLEMQKSPPLPPPKPRIILHKQLVFTSTRLEALATFHHEKEKEDASNG